jgi:hypothetical protein
MSFEKAFSLLIAIAVVGRAQTDPTEFFEKRVRPVLANNCYACHTTSKLGGLELDSRASLLEGGKSGPAIVPGQPGNSLLIKAINHTDAKLKMPMGGAKLKDEEIADLVHWIQIGAPWPENKQTAGAATTGKGFVLTPEKRALWSLQPLQKPAIPAVKNPSWVKTPIDNFVLAKLEEQGMKPLGPADRRTLIRRVTYDLIGLPPTPDSRMTSPPTHMQRSSIASLLLLTTENVGLATGWMSRDMPRETDRKTSRRQKPLGQEA